MLKLWLNTSSICSSLTYLYLTKTRAVVNICTCSHKHRLWPNIVTLTVACPKFFIILESLLEKVVQNYKSYKLLYYFSARLMRSKEYSLSLVLLDFFPEHCCLTVWKDLYNCSWNMHWIVLKPASFQIMQVITHPQALFIWF